MFYIMYHVRVSLLSCKIILQNQKQNKKSKMSRLSFFVVLGFYNFTISCKNVTVGLFFTTPECLLICQIYCDLFTLSAASLNK